MKIGSKAQELYIPSLSDNKLKINLFVLRDIINLNIQLLNSI